MLYFLKLLSYFQKRWRTLILIIIPLALLPLAINSSNESRCAYVVLLMAIFWATEPIPLPITALFPVVLLPLLGLSSTENACAPYLKGNNMLFLGCLTLALAVEKSKLHQRIALRVLISIGTQFQWILLGFMMTTMFFSMWIVSTATVAMMLPIADEILAHLFPKTKDNSDDSNSKKLLINGECNANQFAVIDINDDLDCDKKNKLRKLLYISIAYSATIGSASTLTSNGPNLIMKFILEEIYDNRDPVDYASWFIFAAPVSIIITIVCWLIYKVLFMRNVSVSKDKRQALRNIIVKRHEKLGPITFHEYAVLAVFLTMILLYFFHDPQFMRGWSKFFSINNIHPKPATAAIFCILLLFIIPANPLGPYPSGALLDWKTVQTKLEWGVIILRGGGFSMADAVTSSGLSKLMGQQLALLGFLPISVLSISLSIVSTFLIELMRTSATATIFIPVVANLAEDLNINPLIFIITVTLSCAYAFILPIGTTANTIVYYHADLKITDMLLLGMITKTISITFMLINIYLLGYPIFNLSDSSPEWLNHYTNQLLIHNSTNNNYNSTVY